MGLARYVGLLPFTGASEAAFRGLSTTVLLAVTGWVVGYLVHRLEEADRSISDFRAREEVARTLHDGVLQTLAVIQRRSDDDELVALAKDDGCGFDPASVVSGEGIRRSIGDRMAEVGGRIEVDGRPGRGTEIRIWA
ncbi:MAG: hypothetical protein ACFCVK_01495 [Acidimicrobiales bacterium]